MYEINPFDSVNYLFEKYILCIGFFLSLSRQRKGVGKRKRDLYPELSMMRKIGGSKTSDLDKALEVDLNL